MGSGVLQQVGLPVRKAVRREDGRWDLGPAPAFTQLPATVEVDGTPHFLLREGETFRLLSSVCPHLGSEIVDRGDCFECPHHGWRFDRATGRCQTAPSERMASAAVEVVDGRLLTDLLARPSQATGGSNAATAKDLTITLHAHACLEFARPGFSLLTDPWLIGPAFMGAWVHYPPAPAVDIERMRPDAIWISHEHSDHFHEPTLERFSRDIPVYVPDFPNRRMVKRLAGMGFRRVVAMPFGVPFAIGGGITLTCFEPGSLWNDSVVLVEVEDVDGAGPWRFLNLNDAGLNRRIASRVGPVDVIASSFSPGASGYPLTWTHLSDEQKEAIYERARAGILHMLKEAVGLYGRGDGRTAVLPFAGHFSLWHPAHAGYVRAMKKNTLDDVVAAFESGPGPAPARVVDLMPGETWQPEPDTIQRRWKRRERLYEPEQMMRYLRRAFDPATFEAHHPGDVSASRQAIESYFLSLNRTAEMAFCEELSVTLRVMDPGLTTVREELAFEVRSGTLAFLAAPPETANLVIEIPSGILGAIIEGNLSWDEAHIGYWCRFSRNPDVFHAGFWRLLQAPYFARPAGLTPPTAPAPPTALTPPTASSFGLAIGPDTVIADVLETLGERADRILRRYGLYCTGCQHSTADTLTHGARVHGLGEDALRRLVMELNRLPLPSPTPRAA